MFCISLPFKSMGVFTFSHVFYIASAPYLSFLGVECLLIVIVAGLFFAVIAPDWLYRNEVNRKHSKQYSIKIDFCVYLFCTQSPLFY